MRSSRRPSSRVVGVASTPCAKSSHSSTFALFTPTYASPSSSIDSTLKHPLEKGHDDSVVLLRLLPLRPVGRIHDAVVARPGDGRCELFAHVRPVAGVLVGPEDERFRPDAGELLRGHP